MVWIINCRRNFHQNMAVLTTGSPSARQVWSVGNRSWPLRNRNIRLCIEIINIGSILPYHGLKIIKYKKSSWFCHFLCPSACIVSCSGVLDDLRDPELSFLRRSQGRTLQIWSLRDRTAIFSPKIGPIAVFSFRTWRSIIQILPLMSSIEKFHFKGNEINQSV